MCQIARFVHNPDANFISTYSRRYIITTQIRLHNSNTVLLFNKIVISIYLIYHIPVNWK